MSTTEINVSRETSGFCNSDSGISGDLIQEYLVEDSSLSVDRFVPPWISRWPRRLVVEEIRKGATTVYLLESGTGRRPASGLYNCSIIETSPVVWPGLAAADAPKILAAIYPVTIDALLDEQITVVVNSLIIFQALTSVYFPCQADLASVFSGALKSTMTLPCTRKSICSPQ
jgi:hypothetical protein